MKFVEMRHPEVELPALMPETAVPFHEANGWVCTDAEASAQADQPTEEKLAETPVTAPETAPERAEEKPAEPAPAPAARRAKNAKD